MVVHDIKPQEDELAEAIKRMIATFNQHGPRTDLPVHRGRCWTGFFAPLPFSRSVYTGKRGNGRSPKVQARRLVRIEKEDGTTVIGVRLPHISRTYASPEVDGQRRVATFVTEFELVNGLPTALLGDLLVDTDLPADSQTRTALVKAAPALEPMAVPRIAAAQIANHGELSDERLGLVIVRALTEHRFERKRRRKSWPEPPLVVLQGVCGSICGYSFKSGKVDVPPRSKQLGSKTPKVNRCTTQAVTTDDGHVVHMVRFGVLCPAEHLPAGRRIAAQCNPAVVVENTGDVGALVFDMALA